jgi:hypothetical protein
MMRGLVVSLLLSACLLRAAEAQEPFGVTVGADLSAATVRSESGDDSEKVTGVLIGGVIAVEWWRLTLDMFYLEGTAEPQEAGEGRDVIEGELLAGVRVLPWLGVKVGPHIRSYVLPGEGTQRWVFWEVRLSAAARLGTPILTGYFEGWNALSSELDVAESLDRAQGLEGGLKFEPRGVPLWATLGYRMDHSRLAGGTRRETIEHVILGVGLAIGGNR